MAGKFYPASPEGLSRALDRCFTGTLPEKLDGAIACVVPHAGIMYSGQVAGAVYRRLPERPSYVILGPNHFGNGQPLAVMSRGDWETPLGWARLDENLGQAMLKNCEGLTEDATAHFGEHSIEVQIPFLQRGSPDFTFVPIAVGAVSYEALVTLGQGIAKTLQEAARPVLLIASSDMNHYEPDGITREK
ncbi:MAG TPA: AmmeMemoRadiSam system protein B, partial [Terriglobia bacterium]|nr:AmmeMemoRadiSam system protein B [Terriglobia bacterium]